MTHNARLKIAAAATVLFLGALSVAGIASQPKSPKTASAASPAAAQRSTAASSTPVAAEHEHADQESERDE